VKAYSLWKQARDGHADLLEVAQGYNGSSCEEIMLGAGEAVFCKVSGAALVEERRGQGHYQGRSAGVSVPVGSIAGRPVRYRVGASRGHFVQGAPSPAAIDTGTVFITSKRLIFQGARQTRECAFAAPDHPSAAGASSRRSGASPIARLRRIAPRGSGDLRVRPHGR
jgi:hypothetical protein